MHFPFHLHQQIRKETEEKAKRLESIKENKKENKKEKEPEKGCTEPLYGQKAKAVIQIVPKTKVCDTIQIDERCLKEYK